MAEQEKTRYSDEELAEFKQIIEGMLEKARAEYNTLRGVVMHGGNNDIEDTSPTFRTVEDDGANQLTKEEEDLIPPNRLYDMRRMVADRLALKEYLNYMITNIVL